MVKRTFSISLRLTLWFGALFFAGWMLFGTAMWFNLQHTLTTERQGTLTRRIDRLQSLLIKSGNSEPGQAFTDFAHATGNGLVEIFNVDGRRAFPSPSSAASAFPWPSPAGIRKDRYAEVGAVGQQYLVLARPFVLDDHAYILAAAAPESGNQLVLDNFWRGLWISLPFFLLISSGAGYWISRRALHPVDVIIAKARSISISNLSDRLPVSDTGDELQRLAETCNEMLQRLNASVDRMKQFTADASHELRGPLSFNRTVAEVALRNPSLDANSRAAFQEIVDETAKATALLEDMLTLARADVSSLTGALEPVDLAAIVIETCDIAGMLASRRGLELTVSRSSHSPTPVLGDMPSLRRLVWIILDNAIKYTNSPGSVAVSLRVQEATAVFEVSDTGIGIAQADLPHIFDRFYRADRSRSEVEGSGLGLAIADWIVELHQAQFEVVSEEKAGTTFRVQFPIVTSDL